MTRLLTVVVFTYLIVGTATGKDVDYYADARLISAPIQGQNNISENGIYDLTFVKLREIKHRLQNSGG